MPELENTITQKKKSSVFTKFFKGFGLLLTYEIIEELLEEAIAWTITTVLARALSFLLVVVLTQCTKVTIKYSVKMLKVLLKPLVTKLVYRPGNDKVNFIKKLFCKIFRIESNDNSNELIEVKNDEQNSSENNKQEAVIMADNEVKVSKFKQFVARVVEFVKCNKKSILSTATALATSVGSGGAVQMWCASTNLPNLYTWLIAVIIGIFMFVLTELGVSARGWESAAKFLRRKAEDDAEKDAVKTAKDAMKVVAKTKKEAEKLAAENVKLAKEAEAKAKAEAYLRDHPELLK
jgi:hypothetical protein